MKTKIAIMTLALSSTLMLTACHDDDDDDNSGSHGNTGTNHAPTLVVNVKPADMNAVVKDLVVLEAQGTDADNDTLTYSLNDNSAEYYAIDATTGVVSLTQKGVDFVKTGNTLPEIEVAVTDGKVSATKKATPNITTQTNPSTDLSLTSFLASDANFTILSSALKAVPGTTTNNLGTDIEQMNNITFLAPTDAAINKTLDILVKQAPSLDTDGSGKIELTELVAQPALLKSMLQYHVLTSKVDYSQVGGLLNKNLTTANGLPLFVTQSGADFVIPSQTIQLENIAATAAGTPLVPQAKIDLTNIDTKVQNGVVHVIDQALIPPMYDVDEVLSTLPNTSVFKEFLVVVGDSTGSIGSVAADKAATSYTVLAPKNAAVNQKCVDLNPLAKQYITGGVDIINANNECVLAPLASSGAAVKQTVPISNSIKSGTMFSNELTGVTGNIVEANIIALDGVVHIVDSLQQ